MSDTTPFGFGKFVPGFDFLQNLAKGASGSIPQMPNLSSWIAPTISVEELDKRVQELKAVQFWLEQNSRALSATIQALEVQKMTLATLQGMNFSMGDVANAFKLKTADSVMGGVQKISDSLASAAHSMAAAVHPADAGAKTPAPAAAPAAAPAQPEASAPAPQPGAAKPGAIDPLQWWGALSQQFQHIAGNVLADVAKQAPFDAAKGAASTLAKDAFKTATDMASQMASKGVQSVQEATRAATQLASAAVPAPLQTPAAKKKTTVAKKTTAAKSTSAPASAAPAKAAAVKKSAAAKTPAPAAQTTSPRRAPSKTAR